MCLLSNRAIVRYCVRPDRILRIWSQYGHGFSYVCAAVWRFRLEVCLLGHRPQPVEAIHCLCKTAAVKIDLHSNVAPVAPIGQLVWERVASEFSFEN